MAVYAENLVVILIFFIQKARLCFPGLQSDRWCTRWGWPAHPLCTGTWSEENRPISPSNKVIWCLEKVLSSWEAANSPCRIDHSDSQCHPTPLFCSSSRHQSPVLRIRIQDPGPFLPLDPGSGMGKSQHPDPGYFLELRNHFFGLKYLNSLMRIRDGDSSYPGSGMEKSRIRDKHPGSATLQKSHCFQRGVLGPGFFVLYSTSTFSLLVLQTLECSFSSCAVLVPYSSVDVYRVFTILLTNRDYSLQILTCP